MYAVIDCYEGEAEIVGKAETVEQAKQIERQWAIDTDYECYAAVSLLSMLVMTVKR